jgi:hypothetical protein
MAKCPHCKTGVDHIIMSPITVGLTANPAISVPAVAWCCSACLAVLTVGPDPESVKQDTVIEISRKIDELVAALVKRQTRR